MNPFPYRAVVAWSEADQAYVAKYPALPGIGGDGETEAEAIASAREAAEAAVEVMRRHGDPLPPADSALASETYSGQFRVRLPKSLHRQLAERAELEGVSLNQLVLMLVSANGAPQASAEAKPADGNTLVSTVQGVLNRFVVHRQEHVSEGHAQVVSYTKSWTKNIAVNDWKSSATLFFGGPRPNLVCRWLPPVRLNFKAELKKGDDYEQ